MTDANEDFGRKIEEFEEWQKEAVRSKGESQLIEGEYICVIPSKETMERSSYEKVLCLVKGPFLLGHVVFHGTGQWCFQAYKWSPALTLDAIVFIEECIKNADEIYRNKLEKQNEK